MRRHGLGPISRAIMRQAGIVEELRPGKAVRRKRPYVISTEGDSVRITDWKARSFVLDASDWETLKTHRFTLDQGKICVVGYGELNRTVGLGRVLLGISSKLYVDHIDGDPSNNRRANLRVCTPFENSWNMALPSHNTTGFKGVCKSRGRAFAAYAIKLGKRFNLGQHPTAESAAKAYDAFARQHFGRFACVNFPLEGEQSVHRNQGLPK